MSPARTSSEPVPAGQLPSPWRGRLALGAAGLLVLAILVLLFVGLLLWLGTDSARDIVLGQASRLAADAGIELTVEGASGNFRRGLQARRVRVVNDRQVIEVDDLKTAWSLWPLSGGRLQVGELRAAAVRVTLPPGEPATQADPLILPELALPIDVHVDAVVDRPARVADSVRRPPAGGHRRAGRHPVSRW
ncbi:MAG: hypothetical protein R3E68_22135 [Burkholderiaceae bacterium]